MMVIFTSRSEKKAIYTVRNILDNFADRIGNDTWRTIITEDGLEAVYTALRRNATKNTAVSCHWIRSRSHSELLWVVGKKSAFSINGTVPVNYTSKNLNHSEWENDFVYMPYMKAIVALSALWHDWGKASDFFQNKLRKQSKIADRFRHEFISCKIIEGIIACYGDNNDDNAWLRAIAEDSIDENEIIKYLRKEYKAGMINKFNTNLPANAKFIMWLILSHHHLPNISESEGFCNVNLKNTDMAFSIFSAEWGYANENIDGIKKCEELTFSFSNGLLINNEKVWFKEVKKWSNRLLKESANVNAELAERSILYYSLLVLMLSDHYISSLPNNEKVENEISLWANTCQKGIMNQSLVEHLLGVEHQALSILHQIPLFFNQMEKAENIKSLNKKSPAGFSWQDKAVQEIMRINEFNADKKGFFVVNMASTGCGKTIANAKMVNALSNGNGLRYILALGLRSLTLQTGDEYKKKIGLRNHELAVIIGSTAVNELYNSDNENIANNGSESIGSIAEYDLDYLDDVNQEQKNYLEIFFKESSKNKALLLKPVLVTTIDHIMGASESIRGGHQILPGLRIMSSDLIIDEIDDFGVKDLTAIARLVHLAGLMGRNVIISSATIPPDLAEGLYRAYSDGLSCYNNFHAEKKTLVSMWCDEFKSMSEILGQNGDNIYKKYHEKFIKNRISKLKKHPVNRTSYIVDFDISSNDEDNISEYFNKIKNEAIKLHNDNYVIDGESKKNISFGIIRMANIDPCVKLSNFLLECDLPDDYQIFIMCYHSRQILFLRHLQEEYLDRVMKRKDENPMHVDIKDDILRKHIDNSSGKNIIFILVATPVEEVGRDHDFDWAIVEPSSFRSVVQLAGRIRRHRIAKNDYKLKNIAVMQYNINAVKGKNIAYTKPGFENKSHKLKSHDIKEIAGKYLQNHSIDAIPRIEMLKELNPSMDMVHLEHQIMKEFNSWDQIGPKTIHGWDTEYWWLTGLPQIFNRFREGISQKILYAVYNDGNIEFCEKDKDNYINRTDISMITIMEEDSVEKQKRYWIKRDYAECLKQYVIEKTNNDEEIDMDTEMSRLSKKYGEISIPDTNSSWNYSDQYGLFKNKESEV